MSTIMSDLLLLKEIEEVVVEAKFEPQDEVAEEEMVLGEMNESEKKMYIFYRTLLENLKEAILSGEPMEDGQEHKIKRLSTTIRALFWVCLEHRFNLLEGYEGSGMGVRKGWKVVIKPEREDMENDLEGLFALVSLGSMLD